jgi:uncharacterized membrane protein YcaP (DUF421 family)
MIDWHALLVPQASLLELILRGTVTYVGLFAILRFFMKRQTGVVGIADLLVIVLIADAAQNAMAADYSSITEGAVVILTIVFWNFAIDWLGYHVPWLTRFTRPEPLALIVDGRMLRKNMAQEMITDEELLSQLRQQGVEDPGEVKRAYIEGDGRISVIRRDGAETAPRPDKVEEAT